jgi:hypothetical protein
MKTKSIDRAIGAFTNQIKTIKKKGLNEHAGQAKKSLQTMETDLETSINLQKEVHTLRDSLKIKKKELETGVNKLKKDSKEFKKALKNDKKAAKEVKPGKKNK